MTIFNNIEEAQAAYDRIKFKLNAWESIAHLVVQMCDDQRPHSEIADVVRNFRYDPIKNGERPLFEHVA